MYRRNTATPAKIGKIGFAMFVTAEKERTIDHYGDFRFRYNGENSVKVEDLPIGLKWAGDVADDFNNCNTFMDDYEKSMAADDVAAGFNPSDIVDSAGCWDNPALTAWLWDRVLEPMGVVAVLTDDGAVVFDEDLISKI